MPLTRWIVSTKDSAGSPAKDAIVNTYYFNVAGSVDEPNYTSLGDDLVAVMKARSWNFGRFIDVRGYNMSDPEPRPQKYINRSQNAGSTTAGVAQVALCLSYYADRNLPRQRGRVYLGPWSTASLFADSSQTGAALALAPALAALGGVNVDWSLWSPTTSTATRINHAWVDASWDIIRTRKRTTTTPRLEWTGNG